MSTLQKIAAAVLGVLLLVVGWGLWATNQLGATPVRALKATARPPASGTDDMPVIDESTFLTARRLARLAATPEEQSLAQSAVQIADHELDLAFDAALHELEAHPPPLSAAAKEIEERLLNAQKALASDTENLKRLKARLAAAPDAEKPAIQDQVDLMQSQVELEEDEVQEANTDLLQAGGNVHQRIQMMKQEHQAAERNLPAPSAAPASALGRLKGMVGELRQWLALHDKQRWLTAAQRQATMSAAQLETERTRIAAELAANKARVPELAARGQHAMSAGAPAATTATAAPSQASASTQAPRPTRAPSPARAPPPGPAPPRTRGPSGAPAAAPAATSPQLPAPQAAAAGEPTTLLDLTRRIAAEQHRLTLRDQRITARRRLAAVYGQWDALVAAQARAVLHECLKGAAIVLAAVLLLLFANRWLERLLGRARIDRRQLGTLRSVVGVALQVIGLAVILVVLVGVPGQFGTMLGIVGAGLTVALKDFIVAFIGWFVLMGRNGIRLGDWVEINGVSGEVVELNMFHTVLLETGNWTDAGHPTGRRVTFTNSFAIAGHYFNFSTSGQWLWDELSVMVPYGRDPHAIAAAIEKEVTEATAKDAGQAEEEWRRAARGRDVSFTTQPAIAVRPAAGGVEIAVRYVTRASERLALRARLYQSAVQLLAQPA
jgi:small-conductance mechanosensitive channel